MDEKIPSHNGKTQTLEKLEVENEDERQLRIQTALEKLNKNAGFKDETLLTIPPLNFGGEKPRPIEPPNELLSRVQTFLPQLEESNALLAQRVQADPKSVDIENVQEDETEYIEMNLGLGVFEDRSKAGGSQVPHSESEDDSDSSDDEMASSSDDSSDSSSSSEGSEHPSIPRPIKPLPNRTGNAKHRPVIVVLGSSEHDNPSTSS